MVLEVHNRNKRQAVWLYNKRRDRTCPCISHQKVQWYENVQLKVKKIQHFYSVNEA